jgi:hypothetical protein
VNEIETLTEEERAALVRRDVCYSPPIPLCEKALRIVNAHAAERAALVAVIARVQVLVTTHQTQGSSGSTLAAIREALAGAGAPAIGRFGGGSGVGPSERQDLAESDLERWQGIAHEECQRRNMAEERLAAANARIAELDESFKMAMASVAALTARLDAANARVAELERGTDACPNCAYPAHLNQTPACDVCGRTNTPTEPTDLGNGPVMCVLGHGCWVAANARAEAAERAAEIRERAWGESDERADRAESERDEWKAKCEAAEQKLASNHWWQAVERAESESASLRLEIVGLQNQVEGAELAEERAVAEATSLRAELERVTMLARTTAAAADVLRAKAIERKARLAGATELLKRVPGWNVPADTVKPDRYQQSLLDLTDGIRAFLANAPATKEIK